jgi:hypothetical protein
MSICSDTAIAWAPVSQGNPNHTFSEPETFTIQRAIHREKSLAFQRAMHPEKLRESPKINEVREGFAHILKIKSAFHVASIMFFLQY